MSLIKFNKSTDIINANLSIGSKNRVKIEFFSLNDIPDAATLFSGFVELNEHNHFLQSDFLDMKYVYRIEDELYYTMTNNENDIYVEPAPMESNESNINEIRASKISALSSICNIAIVHGVDIDIDGNVEHFSYSEEDQTNIKEIFDLAVQTKVPMYYHSDGNSCKLYSVEQIIKLYTTAAMNKMHHITYFNQLKMFLLALDDIDTITSIEYGYKLTGEYLGTYNAAIEQAKIGMETLLKAGWFDYGYA